MENASKALIIAGAILLAILIIGLGMAVYTRVKDVGNNSGIDEQKVSAYNSQFEAYEGTQSGTQVRALCDLIRSHNNANVDDETLNISIEGPDASGTNPTNPPATTAPTALVPATTVNDVKTNIKAGNRYTVAFGYDAQTGYIVDCVITKN